MYTGGWRSRCLSFGRKGWMQGLDLVSFAACGQGHGERGCRRCPLPTRRDVTTTCTADNRETNSTAPEYSALAAHHPGACCTEGVSQVRACAKVLSAPRLRVRFRHGIRQRQGASALVSRHRSDVAGGASMASADQQMTGDATLRTNTPPATRPGAAPARRW